MWPAVLIIVCLLLSGFADAQGFIHAGRIWQGGRFIWGEAIKSAIGFQFGIFMFWISLRYLEQFRVLSTEVQTLLWFGVTIMGVALLSGKFLQWQRADQIVGMSVLIGIGWLLIRTE